MTRNQLPDGVGKKIVEALKRQQNEGEVTSSKGRAVIEEKNDNIITENDLTDFGKVVENVPEIDNINFSEDLIIEEDLPILSENDESPSEILFDDNGDDNDFEFNSNPVDMSSREQSQISYDNNIGNVLSSISVSGETSVPVEKINPQNDLRQNIVNAATVNPAPVPQPQETKTAQKGSSVKIPYNVAILNNLIATLPAGVNKQVGAQIIRQTLEATGLSMTGVLKEAQELQEQLNGNTRECMIRIQEYKTNIMQLEQKVQDYQKHIAQINDLISLFLLTDRK